MSVVRKAEFCYFQSVSSKRSIGSWSVTRHPTHVWVTDPPPSRNSLDEALARAVTVSQLFVMQGQHYICSYYATEFANNRPRRVRQSLCRGQHQISLGFDILRAPGPVIPSPPSTGASVQGRTIASPVSANVPRVARTRNPQSPAYCQGVYHAGPNLYLLLLLVIVTLPSRLVVRHGCLPPANHSMALTILGYFQSYGTYELWDPTSLGYL